MAAQSNKWTHHRDQVSGVFPRRAIGLNVFRCYDPGERAQEGRQATVTCAIYFSPLLARLANIHVIAPPRFACVAPKQTRSSSVPLLLGAMTCCCVKQQKHCSGFFTVSTLPQIRQERRQSLAPVMGLTLECILT